MLFVFGLLMTACRAPANGVDLQVVAHGKQLYQSLACNSCHGLDAVGSVRTIAPTHNHIARTAEERIHATDYAGKATTAAEYLRESIVDPKAYVVPGFKNVRYAMPSFAQSSESDVDALVQFLLQQK